MGFLFLKRAYYSVILCIKMFGIRRFGKVEFKLYKINYLRSLFQSLEEAQTKRYKKL